VFLLRLERELQAIDPSVTLPYWKFDSPAPNVFAANFMGGPPTGGQASFDLTNPLATWNIQGLSGVLRSPSYPPNGAPSLLSEANTLALGSTFAAFTSMEGNPHGTAHTSTGGSGWLGSVPTAVRDPIFFLLHCNVDRLWAKWQWVNDRWDPTSTDALSPQGSFPTTSPFGTTRKGHYAEDTMWPWNEEVGSGSSATTLDDRPTTAPGGAFPQTVGFLLMPPAQPQPRHANDYRSFRMFPAPNPGLGFAYDDVEF